MAVREQPGFLAKVSFETINLRPVYRLVSDADVKMDRFKIL